MEDGKYITHRSGCIVSELIPCDSGVERVIYTVDSNGEPVSSLHHRKYKYCDKYPTLESMFERFKKLDEKSEVELKNYLNKH